MLRGPETANAPFFAARGGNGAAIAAIALLSSCASRSHIEPTSPTPAPAAASAVTTATAPEPPLPTPETSATAATAEPPNSPRCAAEASALSRACCSLASTLGGRVLGATVAAGPVEGGAAPARAADLSTRIAVCVARAVGGGARPVTSPLSFEQARKAAAPGHPLLYLTAQLAQGRLRVAAAAHAIAAGRNPSDSAFARAEASAELDGEIGAYLPRIAVAASRIERAVAPSDIVALACGDVAGNGQAEIVAVGRHKVQIGRAGDGRFSPRVETQWSSLSPVAPSPLREPLGSAVIVRGSGVLVGISDRAEGFLLSPALAKVRVLGAPIPLGDDFGCLSRSGIALGAEGPCGRRGQHTEELPVVDAFASGTVVDAEGRSTAVLATRDPATRRVSLRRGAGTTTLAEAGGALAVADLDLDGQPELLASVDTDKPEEDAVVISTWARDGTIAERLRVPVKDGVRAIAVCPAEDVRMAPIVAATTGGLWLVR
ncbi:MAG TPA: hypothetical protein VHC69_33955 [Polyangiaceae bacterium]|nr:hypothetical protein [Polyangiaceae bacterium]